MDTLLEKIAVQTPALVALIILMVICLKVISKLVSDFREDIRHSQEVIEDCTKVMGEVVKVVERCNIGGNHRR